VVPRAGLDVEEKRKNFLPCPYLESNPGIPGRNLVTILTELSQLLQTYPYPLLITIPQNVWGSGGTTPLILKPRHLIEVSGPLQAPAALPPGKEHPVPIGLEVRLVLGPV